MNVALFEQIVASKDLSQKDLDHFRDLVNLVHDDSHEADQKFDRLIEEVSEKVVEALNKYQEANLAVT